MGAVVRLASGFSAVPFKGDLEKGIGLSPLGTGVKVPKLLA